MLIVFEGLDGCGKGTQIERLCNELDAAFIKYPRSKFSMLDDYLTKKIQIEKKALFLLFLADIMDGQDEIRSAMESHEHVVLDRYVFSTIAYEKDAYGFDRAMSLVRDAGFIVPDKVVLLDITADVSQERKSAQKELDRYEENLEYLADVRSRFLELAKQRFLTPNWYKLDARKGIDDVYQDILKAIE
jgi:dTMP kinase